MGICSELAKIQTLFKNMLRCTVSLFERPINYMDFFYIFSERT